MRLCAWYIRFMYSGMGWSNTGQDLLKYLWLLEWKASTSVRKGTGVKNSQKCWSEAFSVASTNLKVISSFLTGFISQSQRGKLMLVFTQTSHIWSLISSTCFRSLSSIIETLQNACLTVTVCMILKSITLYYMYMSGFEALKNQNASFCTVYWLLSSSI